MTPGEFAFLALGLILGTAMGAAIVVIGRSRPATREVRVTVSRNAVPRRGSTLAADAFAAGSHGPAAGGPGDRRQSDRSRVEIGTPVRFGMSLDPRAASRSKGRAVSISIRPEKEGLLARLGPPTPPPELADPCAASRTSRLLWRVLDGDHLAMLELLDGAGADAGRRRNWEVLLSQFVAAVADRAIDLGIIDVPMGNPFWDTFTVDQCREIILALALMDRRFDGRDGWVGGLAPDYRDLSQAVANIAVDPRRIRAWPNRIEIGELFHGARPATREALERSAPALDPRALRAFLGDRGDGLEDLWLIWDEVNAGVGAGVPAAV